MFDWSKLRRQDPALIILMSLLMCIGLVSVFTTTFFPEKTISSDFWQQLVFYFFGICVYLAVVAVRVDWLQEVRISILIWLICLATLLLLFIVGTGAGTQRWINLGPVSLQPAEFVKLGIILVSARIWSSSGKDGWRLAINAAAVLPLVLLIWRQPSLGNALITGTIWLLTLSTLVGNLKQILSYLSAIGLGAAVAAMIISEGVELWIILLILFICGVLLAAARKFTRLKLRILLILMLGGVLAVGSLGLSWQNLLTDYQRQRIGAYLAPESDPLGAQWQVRQSQIAIASGGLLGRGLLQGTQTNYGLLPYAYTDFAYAAFAEQFGALGSLTILAIIGAVIWRLFSLANQLEDTYLQFVVNGVGILLLINTAVNIGMNLGVLPVTGVPLPLISYGGSAVLTNILALALAQSAAASQTKHQVSKMLELD